MKNLILRELETTDEEAFFIGLKEWPEQERTWYTFDWKPGVSFLEHLNRLKLNKIGYKLPQGHVSSSMLYGFVDQVIVGRVNVRHTLNEFLLERGGHIGYSVAKAYRRNGYAKQMFAQVLPYCKSLGLNKILITCSDNNMPSVKLIEHFGGQLESSFFDDQKNEKVLRYWLQL